MTNNGHPREVVPYGSAYGVDNQFAQDRLKAAAIVLLDHAMLAFAELTTAPRNLPCT